MRTPLVATLAAAVSTLTAAADITGPFLPAQDGINTFQSVDGTSAFSSTTATTGLWHERVGVFNIDGITPSGAYQGQDKSGARTHNEVITTITGLVGGKSYDVSMVMGINTSESSGDQDIGAGFTSGSLTTLPESGGTSTGLSLAAGGTWIAVQQLIGTAVAGPSDPARSPGPFDLPALTAHANANGIGMILYVNHQALEAQLDEILPLYESWGVAGIKFGFVNVGSQNWTDWLHQAVGRCAEHKIMVNVHDEYRMTGVERTLPHFMTAEGIRGDEASPRNEDVLKTIFTRSLAGAGDQTNVYFDSRVATIGSHASQLAKTICVYSPWQHVFWYDRPPASPAPIGAGGAGGIIQDVPEMTFFERLPTTWDETRVLDGYPGAHVKIARRKGATWFVGALNGTVTRDFQVPLDFLEAGRDYDLEVFSDDAGVPTATQVRIDNSVVDHNSIIDRNVGSRNGFAATLTPGGFDFSYRVSTAGSQLNSRVELGTNLMDWQTAMDGVAGVSITPGPDAPDGTPTVLVSFPRNVDPRLFARLAVSLP